MAGLYKASVDAHEVGRRDESRTCSMIGTIHNDAYGRIVL